LQCGEFSCRIAVVADSKDYDPPIQMRHPRKARKLGLTTGTPVLVYVRTTYSDSRPLRLTLTIFAGDRNRVVYEIGDLQAYTPAENGDAS
jgi:GntR family transcriptional regulator